MKSVAREFAEDWFTVAPKYRTADHLATHINKAIRAQTERRQLQHVWKEMHNRCENPAHKQYSDYGGRGIAVCERWSDFATFLADMGPRGEDRLLERIDNNGGYEPGNCKWASRVEQNSNRRNCIYVEIDGERITLKEAARRRGLKYRPVHKRVVSRGWDVARALSTPIGIGNCHANR